MTDLRTNEWFGLTYFNPVETLDWLRHVRSFVSSVPHELSERTLRLRDGKQKRIRELRDISILCHGLATQVVGAPLLYANSESQDYDTITCWQRDGELRFTPIQLKELPPEEYNVRVKLPDIFAGLARSPCLHDTVVAIKVNRMMDLNLNALPSAPDHVGGLWLFGGASPDQEKWWLYGDMTAEPRSYWFDYPVPPSNSPRIPLNYRLRASLKGGGDA